MTRTKLARKQIGDGKMPNKYWVSISSDYSYVDEGCIEYIGDIYPEWEKKYSVGELLEVFSSYKEARRHANLYFIGMSYKDYVVNRITIEDRLTGEVYNEELILNIGTGKTSTHVSEYIGFTKEQLGDKFK